MGKHFRYTITDDSFDFERDNDNIEREATLDGIYIIRTSLTEEAISANEAVKAPNAHPSSAQQRLQTPPRQRLLPRSLPMGCPSTVSERFFLILLRLRKIKSKTTPAACPSSALLALHPCSTKLSTSSESIPARCKQYTRLLLTLIAKSSKHENAKQPHWAQTRSSCWGTRSPPL